MKFFFEKVFSTFSKKSKTKLKKKCEFWPEIFFAYKSENSKKPKFFDFWYHFGDRPKKLRKIFKIFNFFFIISHFFIFIFFAYESENSKKPNVFDFWYYFGDRLKKLGKFFKIFNFFSKFNFF